MAEKKKQNNCALCGKKLNFFNTAFYKGDKVCSDCRISMIKKNKKISETKVTCLSCGNVWHYGKQERIENFGKAMQQTGKTMSACSGCFPALLIPNQEVKDFNRCQKCGSRAIKKKAVTYEVK